MSPQALAVHEQMLRHFTGVWSAIGKMLDEIKTELKEIREGHDKQS